MKMISAVLEGLAQGAAILAIGWPLYVWMLAHAEKSGGNVGLALIAGMAAGWFVNKIAKLDTKEG